MRNLYKQFYQKLPVYSSGADEHLHTLNEDEIRQIRRYERGLVLVASSVSVLGFLFYYLPVYAYPRFFPTATLAIPLIGSIKVAWAEFLWCISLTTIELMVLVFLNIAGVHGIAAATGFLNASTKAERCDAILQIGLETKSKQIAQYGIDPFDGLNTWMLFLYNAVFRLKGWLGYRVMRYLARLLLGRYAVRAALDFSGLPIYMAINALAVHSVLREARVIMMGQAVMAILWQRLPRLQLTENDKTLLYDTLQYIAVSKRDFHENHYVLTKALLSHFAIPTEPRHRLPSDYLSRLSEAPMPIAAICKLVILLGFILDGHVSLRERVKLGHLNRLGIVHESFLDVKRHARDYLSGAGIGSWSEVYLIQLERAS